jgi:hypothetical protein
MAATLKLRLTPNYPFTLEVEGDAGREMLSFRLCYDFNALALIEEKTGWSLLTGAIFNHLTAGITLTMFWAGVLAYHPEYATDAGRQVLGSMITHRNAAVVSDAVSEAFIKSLPDDQQARIRDAAEAARKAVEAKARGEELAAPSPLASPATPVAA